MLIPFAQVKQYLNQKNIQIRGILHIGAHECEELKDYKQHGVSQENITWIEANPTLVTRMKERGISVIQAAVHNQEQELPFYVTNNGQSSSLLQFGTHEKNYPWCKVVATINVKTQTLETVIRDHTIPMEQRNFWNLDIQGSELVALQSSKDFIYFADAI